MIYFLVSNRLCYGELSIKLVTFGLKFMEINCYIEPMLTDINLIP
jgi:hypothetical protein